MQGADTDSCLIAPFVCLPIVSLSICLSVQGAQRTDTERCLTVPICLSIYLSIFLFVQRTQRIDAESCLTVPHVSPFIHLSLCPSTCLSVHPPVCLGAQETDAKSCLTVPICLSICPLVCSRGHRG